VEQSDLIFYNPKCQVLEDGVSVVAAQAFAAQRTEDRVLKTKYEFRVEEQHAHLLFRPDEGTKLGESVRKIEITADDPRFRDIGRLQRDIMGRTDDTFFFAGWAIHHRYSARELEAAELFLLRIDAVFEPVGEECGTVYDDSQACPKCGAGWKQVSDLVLDLRKAPKSKAIARTIADEVIVSQSLAEAIMDARITGVELRQVKHKARYEDDAIDLSKVPSGRELMRRGEAAGAPQDSWEFMVWLNRQEQRELIDLAHQEYARIASARDAHRRKPLPVWYQPVVVSARAAVSPATRFGINPFDEDPEGEYRCPEGHVKGLDLLSEVSVSRDSWDGSDIVCTAGMVGARQGLFRPHPFILISRRFLDVLHKAEGKGYGIEVAHLV
jgi:hypothetical protein